MFQSLRSQVRRNATLRSFVGHTIGGSGLFDWYFRSYHVPPVWQERIARVVASPDNAFIPRVEQAGRIAGGAQVMHNGIRIKVGSYYGPEVAVQLQANRGVHEPQEERIFQMVLAEMPAGATMLELGSFWAFYSLWFKTKVKDARNIMLEAEAFNLESGRRNFALNGQTGEWLHAYAGGAVDQSAGTPTLTVDHIMREKSVQRLDMLHSDIQGHELAMLDGASQALSSGRVRYVFISTHGNDIHRQCEAKLRGHGYTILASIDIDDSFAEDGLIVARHPSYDGIGPVDLSRRSTHRPD